MFVDIFKAIVYKYIQTFKYVYEISVYVCNGTLAYNNRVKNWSNAPVNNKRILNKNKNKNNEK